jgi:hypothetical protein
MTASHSKHTHNTARCTEHSIYHRIALGAVTVGRDGYNVSIATDCAHMRL